MRVSKLDYLVCFCKKNQDQKLPTLICELADNIFRYSQSIYHLKTISHFFGFYTIDIIFETRFLRVRFIKKGQRETRFLLLIWLASCRHVRNKSQWSHGIPIKLPVASPITTKIGDISPQERWHVSWLLLDTPLVSAFMLIGSDISQLKCNIVVSMSYFLSKALCRLTHMGMVCSWGLSLQDSVNALDWALDNEMPAEDMTYPSSLASRVVEGDEGEADDIIYPSWE